MTIDKKRGLVFLAGLLSLASAGVREEVSFATADGGIVYAHIYGQGQRGVVLAHGGRFNKESWTAQAERLAQVGFRVASIDFRGRGRSRGPAGTGSSDEGAHFDVLAAVDYLRRTGATSVFVVGASFGGGEAALAAIEKPGAIDRLVLLAASGIDNTQRLKGRTLFITARDDVSGSGKARLEGIRRQFEKAPAPKELVVLEGSAHAQFIFETDQGERLMQEIIRFLSAP